MKLKLQSASFDTWEQKYQLKDKYGNKIEDNVNDMADRIARKLSSIESKDNGYWYQKFYELMSEGYAFPAGRIMSNAGAEEYKPKTSTINCTVSNIIYDSIESIFENVKEAGSTLVSGAGIGYNFSNLRPDNAYVSGAGAKTSGPISFANIYDNACKTISSAGGRRGAQMLTFSIGHPDVESVIDAKREDGALRQFNISILITEEFLDHLRNNKPFPLAFPIKKEDYTYKSLHSELIYRKNEAKESERGAGDYIVNENGEVLMEVYRYVDPNELFEKIMTSTYEYSDPGFILIDNSNYYNNNRKLGEDIYATNPCVIKGTKVNTKNGYRNVEDIKKNDKILTVLGEEPVKEIEVHDDYPIYKVSFSDGGEQYVTESHRFHVLEDRRKSIERKKLRDMKIGDRVQIHTNREYFEIDNDDYTFGLKQGILLGDGCYTQKTNELHNKIYIGTSKDNVEYNELVKDLFGKDKFILDDYSGEGQSMNMKFTGHPSEFDLKYSYSHEKDVNITNISRSQMLGILDGLLATDGNVNNKSNHPQLRWSTTSTKLARTIRNIAIALGAHATISWGKTLDKSKINGREIKRNHLHHTINVSGESFRNIARLSRLEKINPKKGKELINSQKDFLLSGNHFHTKVESIEFYGYGTVYDLYCEKSDTWVTEGYVSQGCGEQLLPPSGSCLLGSVNLTQFVKKPFTDRAEFDFEKLEEVVRVFSRLLDNVVEISNLPLESQEREIKYKRRHGMGAFGLGSALAMMTIPYGLICGSY